MYIGVVRCVYLQNGKSDSVWLWYDTLRLRCVAMQWDAKLCLRVNRRQRRDSCG